MKKKNKTDQEEKIQNNTDKTADNKENSNTRDTTKGKTDKKNGSTESEQSGNDDSAGSTDEADKFVAELKTVEAKLAEMQDKYVRLSAEFDNYRKRTLREKMEMTKYAGEDLFLKIIPIMDDFDRALIHMETASDCLAMKNGIDLIYVKFSEFLKQNGIKEIESLDTPFNVDLHEAVAKLEVPEEDKKGKVVDVVLKGYYLQDKILRFSKVVVGE